LLKRTLIGLIRSFETTGEKARDPALKTRHYKIPKERLQEETLSVLKKLPGFKILHLIDNMNEILVERKTFTGRVQDVTITLFALGPNRSAIDIYSASRGSLGDLGSNYRTILLIYNELDRRLAAYKISS